MNEQTPSVSVAPVLRPMLPGTGSILQSSWSDYARRFWTYMGISVLPMALVIILAVIGGAGSVVGIAISDSPYLVGGGIVLLIVAAIVVMVIYLWSQIALVYAITHSEQHVGIKESYKQTWGKIGGYFWISLVSGFIVMCGTMLFAIPGIIFAVWFIFPIYIYVNEGDHGFQALMKSREYVRNYWWPVFGRVLVLLLIIAAIFIAFMILSVVLTLTMKDNTDMAGAIIQIIQSIGQLLIYPFMMVFYVKLYLALKTIKGQVVLGAESEKDKKLVTILTVLGFVAPIILVILVLLAVQ